MPFVLQSLISCYISTVVHPDQHLVPMCSSFLIDQPCLTLGRLRRHLQGQREIWVHQGTPSVDGDGLPRHKASFFTA